MTHPLQHTLSTWRTADQVEALEDGVLTFRMDRHEAEREVYGVGDYAIVTSKDGCTFLGEVSDVEDDNLRFYVELT